MLALGQDGLVANTLKYLDRQPLIAVNPDPDRYDGILLPFVVEEASTIIQDIFKRGRQTQTITFGEVQLNDGQRLPSFRAGKYQQKIRLSLDFNVSLLLFKILARSENECPSHGEAK